MGDKLKKYGLTIYLFKNTVKCFDECIKAEGIRILKYNIDEKYQIDGEIVVGESKEIIPSWKSFLDGFSKDELKIKPNIHNEAVLLARIEGRVFAVTFGYGKSLLDLSKIESDFGFRTALNLVDADKIKSMNSAVIDTMIVLTQKQTSYCTSSNEFDLGSQKEIVTAINGLCNDVSIADSVNGREALYISSSMIRDDLKNKLKEIYKAYNCDRYKEFFPYVDNVERIKDKEIINSLNDDLILHINHQLFTNLTLSPPSSVNWDSIKGFRISGNNNHKNIGDENALEVDVADYFTNLQIEIDKRFLDNRKLLAIDYNGNEETVCSLYKALSVQLDYLDVKYILFDGRWYKVNNDFYKEVHDQISAIPESNIVLPDCDYGISENYYNKEAAKYTGFALMDCKLSRVKGGPKNIEACDLLTRDKQFVHVKKYSRSSTLSHLFSQGKVSAICFLEDPFFRNEVYDYGKEKLKLIKREFTRKPSSEEIEVVYAIIIDSEKSYSEMLEGVPFFSLVNLMVTYRELRRMHVKCTIKFIRTRKS